MIFKTRHKQSAPPSAGRSRFLLDRQPRRTQRKQDCGSLRCFGFPKTALAKALSGSLTRADGAVVFHALGLAMTVPLFID
ncbi:hypothetical protein GCWU000246_01500 [Jonquetella anthropi E3_33 E1]|nr:hypothetical protein GCWU000246_01500 [Jonquetella anthropi E3_33 E1]